MATIMILITVVCLIDTGELPTATDDRRLSCEVMGGGKMTTPLHQLKAEFFKTLGHPARIRVLELLSEREMSVGEILPQVRLEASNLSQQLAVLRRAGLVTTRKEGSAVYYSLTSQHVAELLAVARAILTSVLADQTELLDGLRADAQASGRARVLRGTQ